MVVREVLTNVIRSLNEHKNTNSAFEANLLVRYVLGFSQLDMVIHTQDIISDEHFSKIKDLTNMRNNGVPLQYILGTQEFMSLEFKVTPDVLIPRSDTETLVEHMISLINDKSVTVADIGTGSGCIAISIAHYCKNTTVTGFDISQRSINIAQQNAKLNKVNHRVDFIRKDIMNDDIVDLFDMIVSNPPYIETDIITTLDTLVKDKEPYHALDGGIDGLDFYKRIIHIAPTILNDNGVLAFEVGHTQANEVVNLMNKNFYDIKIIHDLCSIERVVIGTFKELS